MICKRYEWGVGDQAGPWEPVPCLEELLSSNPFLSPCWRAEQGLLAGEACLSCRCPWCLDGPPDSSAGQTRAVREECLPWCSMLGHCPCTPVALPASEFCPARPFGFFAIFVGGSFPSSSHFHL